MTSGGNRNPANPETGDWMDRTRRRRFTPTASFTHGRGTNPNGSRQVRAQCNSAPRANAFVERFVGTVRRECLDRLLIFGRPHLQRVLAEYVVHYNEHRPHRALGQLAPLTVERPSPTSDPEPAQLQRRDAVLGLINEYRLVA